MTMVRKEVTTSALIDTLVECGTPVRRLRPPLLRAAAWLLFSGLVFGLIALLHGVRPDILERLHEPAFVLAMAGALATGISAAVACFQISLPDSSRLWLLLPAPALAFWVSTIGYGCFTDWIAVEPDGIRPGEAVRCFATLLLVSVPLSLAMLMMVRYAALLRPTLVSIVAGLSVAAMTALALSLFHEIDATAMVLVWNLGAAAIIAGLNGMFGEAMLRWILSRLAPSPPPSVTRSGYDAGGGKVV
jgi:hypothetical protein